LRRAYTNSASPWLGRIPEDWVESRFRYEAVISGGQVDPRAEPWSGMVLIAPNHIESGTGRLLGRETAADQGADSGKYVATAGQILYSKIRPALNKAAIAVEDCLCSADMYAISLSDRLDTRFARYFMSAKPFHDFATAMSMRVKMPKVNREELADGPWLLPQLPEQRAIANYLDRETARIDTLIEEQQRLIEILRERRHSLVDGVFDTQPPNTRLQNACTDVVDCPHTTPEVADDGAYEAVRTASVRNGKFRSGNGLPVSAETWEARNAGGAPSVGDVLFTREAPAGEACMVPNEQICLGQRMVLLRIDNAVCVGEFLLWQIYSDRVQDHFLLSANGSTVANIRLPILRTTSIWLPSIEEQRRIAAYLNEQTAKIDALIEETERFIELARERRGALITAAVTGQIDVREMAA